MTGVRGSAPRVTARPSTVRAGVSDARANATDVGNFRRGGAPRSRNRSEGGTGGARRAGSWLLGAVFSSRARGQARTTPIHSATARRRHARPPDPRYAGAAVPPAIAQGLRRAYDASGDAPLELFTRGTSWRCVDGKVYACNVGANLPCDEKADTSRTPSAPIAEFCRQNPGAPVVPMVVTGRATVYEWRCGQVPVSAAMRPGLTSTSEHRYEISSPLVPITNVDNAAGGPAPRGRYRPTGRATHGPRIDRLCFDMSKKPRSRGMALAPPSAASHDFDSELTTRRRRRKVHCEAAPEGSRRGESLY